MTTPDEAARAVANTREFLIELLNRPRVPKEIREKAHRLLKHYPLGDYQEGCDHCRHPLYAAIKCKQCGRVTE